ncbi:MAG: hypothetical protein HFH68_01245 [Lachnospiraceae bacterium]|nr:hypothetical protein [Lachnospiraceae bacterium]
MPSKRKSNKRAKMEKRRVRHNQNKKEGVNMTENIAETTEMASEDVAEAVVAESKPEDMAASEAAELNTEAVNSTIVVTAEEEPAVIVEEEKMENKKTENTANTTNIKETVHKLYIQYNDLEFSDELLFEAAVNAYCNESGMDKSSVEAVNLYVKPQEGRAYYVINNDAEKSGSIEL